MVKKYATFLFLLTGFLIKAQEVGLPTDFRQHNLTEYNSNLWNPVFSLDRNGPSSIAFWSRYQWQHIDSDPSSLFLTYTGRINPKSSFGIGFMQHNTGVFANTGGMVNYAYAFDLGNKMRLSVGLNLFGFNNELADDRYRPDPDIDLPQMSVSDAFIMQLAPGIRFSVDRFGIGLVSDNLFDYNFSTNKGHSDGEERTFAGMVDYRFPLTLFSWTDGAYLLPMLYIRSVPYGDTQIGLNALLSSDKFWVQGGYNSFYGVSGGLGGRFFKHLSLGALIEAGTDPELKGKDPSFELVAAYSWGAPASSKKEVGLDEDMEEIPLPKKEDRKVEKVKKPQDTEVVMADKAPKKEKKQKRTKRKSKKVLEEEMRVEMELAEAKRLKEKQEAEALATAIRLEEERKLDSIKQVELAFSQKINADLEMIAARKKAGKPVTRGHYEEVEKLEGEKAGFYLIANVYGTQRYRDLFIQGLQKKGINARSVFVPQKKFDYVYLERYDTLGEAEEARDSKFDGKYADRIWIFRIIGD